MNSEQKMLTMPEALCSRNSSITVQNVHSELYRFYHMNVPFQITLEYCNSSNPEDFINIVTLSPEKEVLYQETVATKNYYRIQDVMHFHDFFEFVVVLEGNIIQKIEGKEYLYSAGSCCLINRSLCHLERYQGRCKVFFIGMSPEFVSELFTSAQNSAFSQEKDICRGDIFRFITADLKNPGEKAYLDFIPSYQNHRNVSQLHRLAQSMMQTFFSPEFGASYQIRGLLCAFLSYLSSPRYFHCTNIKMNSGSDFLIFSRITRLLEECDGRMTRSALAEMLNYSGDYLNRIVNKYTGMCLYDYGMTICLKRAARYLTETDDSISAIVSRLKITNRTHFYTLFKNKYGVTPKEYRKLHGCSP